MQWAVGRLLAVPLWLFAVVVAAYMFVLRIAEYIGRRLGVINDDGSGVDSTQLSLPLRLYLYAFRIARKIGHGPDKFRYEIGRIRREAHKVAADIAIFSAEQSATNPLDRNRKTVFLTITCGQAVRNFLLSDVRRLLAERYYVVILTPFAYSQEFRAAYAGPGIHVLPWFTSFRSASERLFQYYLMRKSGSSTHQGWLANLETRAKTATERRARFVKHYTVLRVSELLGSVFGRGGMQALYHAYFLSYLPRSMFKQLFSTYEPALVVSTTAHHAETWPLTYAGRRYGATTIANILSWDNTSTKPTMDASCDYYTVWSDEMEGEFERHYPYVKTKLVVTGSPLFDMYYNRRGAKDRASFLKGLGLPPELPYVLWTTNTPSGMPDENKIISSYWDEIQRTPLGDKISLLVRLHPKEDEGKYTTLLGLERVALTRAGSPHWKSSDRWLPTPEDMGLLLNSMMHAAVSINVASTMSLESFALNLPTINVAFKYGDIVKDHNLMWSFDMYHTSEHYRAIVDNGSVALAKSMDELIAETMDALEHFGRRTKAMRKTLEQKAAYCDGTSALRFVEALSGAIESQGQPVSAERPEFSGARQAAALSALQQKEDVTSLIREALLQGRTMSGRRRWSRVTALTRSSHGE
jgi:hypothetical protein